MKKKAVTQITYTLAGLLLVYIVISFVQVNLSHLGNQTISEYNFFQLLVKLGGNLHSL